MTKTVTIAATRAGGEPYAHHDVIVTLVAGSAGGVVGSNVIVEQSTVKLNNLGQGSVVLQTNDVEITSPSTSFYRLTVADSSPTITRSIRVTDDLPSTVAWTLADIQVGDPTIPQRDVSSDYVTIGGQSLTNYLASRTSAGFTVPLVGQWNVGGDQVLSLLAQFTDITPHFGTPTTDVDIAVGTTITGDVGVADIPNAWTHLPPAQPPESYVGFNLSVGVVEQVVGLGVPFWGRNIYIFGDSEWTATVHFFYRDGFPADSTGDVDVVIIADGIAHEITVPGSPVGEEGAPASAPFPLRAMPPTAGQQIIDGDTSVTGIEGTIVNNGPNGTAITAVLPRPAPGTELVVVSGANDGVFDADGDDIVVAATGATASTYALPARSVVTLGFLEGAWTVLDDTSTGGGGVALGETSSTAYRGDHGKTAYDHTSLTNNPHSVTAAQVGAASNAAVPFKAQVGDWVSEPHDGIYAATQTLNRLTYVPWLVPAGFAQTDGIAVEVTTVATSALCRLGIYLPHATTGRPGALVIDGGTVDFSSGGGAAGIRTLTITATNLTPGSLIYVAVVPQGATAAARHINSGEVLRAYGYASSTVADVFRANGASAYYEGSVTGALPVNATPLIANIVGQPLVALRRSA